MILTDQYLFQDLKMPIMGVGVHQEVINVDDDVLEVFKVPPPSDVERRQDTLVTTWVR
jgi:hypothetical protein